MSSRLFKGVIGTAQKLSEGVYAFAVDHNDKQWSGFMKACAQRRAAYNNDLNVLFPDWNLQNTKERLLMPDMTIRNLVKKFAVNIFPNGTTFNANDETANKILQGIILETKLKAKLPIIVTEAGLNGYCVLRSVWDEVDSQWVIEVKPAEYSEVHFDENSTEKVAGISFCFPVMRGGKKFWYKEKWTKEKYQIWPEKPEVIEGQRPKFNDDDRGIVVEVNTYGDIPCTVVWHQLSTETYYAPLIRDDDIWLAKSLIRLRNKRHYAHLEHGDPTLVIKNNEGSEPIQRGVGATIKISSADQHDAEASLLEMSGLPDSYRQELIEGVKDLYDSAGLTPPSDEETFKAGVQASAVALRIRDKGEVDTIEGLRETAYSQVLVHLKKLLLMGKATKKTNLYKELIDNESPYEVTAKYPDFFPKSDDEILVGLSVLESSHLSAKERGEREAQLLGVTDQTEIKEIIANIEQDKDIAIASNMNDAGLIDENGEPVNANTNSSRPQGRGVVPDNNSRNV